ncbi:MAG: DDE-type integrase/transposase/recombinase [Candidatus Sulfotelmatobacter sp.]
MPRNTIHRILLRHDLVREEERHSPAVQRFERDQPNQLWQMDFKGPKGWPQPVGPLSVLDDHSRYLIALAANGSTRREPVQHQLEEAFQRCGVPDGMLMDHGTPWWNTRAGVARTHLPGTFRRVGAGGLGPTSHDGLLLHHPGPRTRPRNPALDHHRALDSGA